MTYRVPALQATVKSLLALSGALGLETLEDQMNSLTFTYAKDEAQGT